MVQAFHRLLEPLGGQGEGHRLDTAERHDADDELLGLLESGEGGVLERRRAIWLSLTWPRRLPARKSNCSTTFAA